MLTQIHVGLTKNAYIYILSDSKKNIVILSLYLFLGVTDNPLGAMKHLRFLMFLHC